MLIKDFTVGERKLFAVLDLLINLKVIERVFTYSRIGFLDFDTSCEFLHECFMRICETRYMDIKYF